MNDPVTQAAESSTETRSAGLQSRLRVKNEVEQLHGAVGSVSTGTLNAAPVVVRELVQRTYRVLHRVLTELSREPETEQAAEHDIRVLRRALSSAGDELAAAEQARDEALEGTPQRSSAIADVVAERNRQDEKWGTVEQRNMGHQSRLGFNTGALWDALESMSARSLDPHQAERYARAVLEEDPEGATVADIFLEELAETMTARLSLTSEHLREELVQCAAVLIFAVESIDYERSKT